MATCYLTHEFYHPKGHFPTVQTIADNGISCNVKNHGNTNIDWVDCLVRWWYTNQYVPPHYLGAPFKDKDGSTVSDPGWDGPYPDPNLEKKKPGSGSYSLENSGFDLGKKRPPFLPILYDRSKFVPDPHKIPGSVRILDSGCLHTVFKTYTNFKKDISLKKSKEQKLFNMTEKVKFI